MPKTFASYAGPTFTDPNHPGYGVNFLVLTGPDKGGFDFDVTTQATTHRVNFAVPWEGLDAFLLFALGGIQSVGGVATRVVPAQSPYPSIFPNTYCLRATGKGDGSDSSVTDTRPYSDCVLTLEFGTLTWEPEGDQPYIEINYAGSADYDTIPDAKLQFEGNEEEIDHDAGILVGQVAIQVSLHMVPDPDATIANLNALKGKVSSEDMVIDGFTYPAGTIHFPTYDLTKTKTTQGLPTAEAVVHLIQRDLPWNKAIRSDGVVDTVVVAGTSINPYVTDDLNGIFSA